MGQFSNTLPSPTQLASLSKLGSVSAQKIYQIMSWSGILLSQLCKIWCMKSSSSTVSNNEKNCLSLRFYSIHSCFSTAELYFFTKVLGQEYKSSRSTEG